MALINPSNLYSGGNVVLDAMPYVRMAMAARERKAAREEAVDKYYQNLPNTINDKGVRDQEVPIISDIKNQMMETYLKNRDAIKRGDPAAQLELSKLARQGLSVARNSQNASKIDMEVGKMALNKQNLPILTSPEFIQQHQAHNLPVTDPNYKPLDISGVLAARPFDENEYRKSIKSNYKYSEGVPTVAPHPTDKSLNVITTNPILDKPTKEQMYADAAEQYHSNPTFEKKIHDLGANPETLNRLNEVSKATFGKEIEEPEDIAAAYTASLLPSMTTKAVVKPSAEYANAEKEKLQAQRLAAAAERQRISEAGKNARVNKLMSDENVDYPLNVLVENYGVNKEIKSAEGQPFGTITKIKETDIPVGQLEMFNKKDKYGNRQVEPMIDPETKEPVYNAVKNAEGNWELIGEGGKKIGADDVREMKINKTIPANKEKRKMLLNKPTPKKDPLGIF